MANSNTPMGFKPVQSRNGSPYNGAVREYSFAAGDSTAAFIGDPVKLAGTSQVIDDITYADVVQGTAAATVIGVIVGFKADSRDSLIYRAASTHRVAFVADDPALLFEVQEVSTGTALTANDIGLNVNFVVAAGSTATGFSGVTLNNATEATTNTLDCQIMGLVSRADNEVGSAAKWLVRLNNHQFSNQTAGV